LTDDERVELSAIREDLQVEEADQHSDRGHASARILRAIARLDRLLEGTPATDQRPAAGSAEKL
jgi:hypothetical protein